MKPLKNHLIIKTLRYIKNRYKVDPVKILNSWYKEYYIIQVQKKIEHYRVLLKIAKWYYYFYRIYKIILDAFKFWNEIFWFFSIFYY